MAEAPVPTELQTTESGTEYRALRLEINESESTFDMSGTVSQLVASTGGASSSTNPNVFIAGLPSHADTAALERLLVPFGPLESLKVVSERHFAFARFKDSGAAAACIQRLHKSHFPDSTTLLHVAEAMHTESAEEQPNPRLFVRGLPPAATEATLRALAEPFGEVTSANIIIHTDGQCKGSGFVTLSSVEEATKCLESLNGKATLLSALNSQLPPPTVILTVSYSESEQSKLQRRARNRERIAERSSQGQTPSGRPSSTRSRNGQSPGAASGSTTPVFPATMGRQGTLIWKESAPLTAPAVASGIPRDGFWPSIRVGDLETASGANTPARGSSEQEAAEKLQHALQHSTTSAVNSHTIANLSLTSTQHNTNNNQSNNNINNPGNTGVADDSNPTNSHPGVHHASNTSNSNNTTTTRGGKGAASSTDPATSHRAGNAFAPAFAFGIPSSQGFDFGAFRAPPSPQNSASGSSDGVAKQCLVLRATTPSFPRRNDIFIGPFSDPQSAVALLCDVADTPVMVAPFVDESCAGFAVRLRESAHIAPVVDALHGASFLGGRKLRCRRFT